MKNDQNLQRDWGKSRPFQFDLTRRTILEWTKGNKKIVDVKHPVVAI